MKKVTESPSLYRHLEKMSTSEILESINREDQKVADAVKLANAQIEALVDSAYEGLKKGGRIFYMGSGTSGRLGILDASECPPTFGVEHGIVVGLIAGGDAAIRIAQEKAEDDLQQGFKDLQGYDVNENDFVVGLSASGTTPYVLGALKKCDEQGISTACICCNPNSAIAAIAMYPVEVITGPEFVTGSTRMKAGTAQKMVLNMISTALMVKMGRVKDNKMVDMALSNDKLVERGTKMVMELYDIEEADAQKILLEKGSVRAVIQHFESE